MDYKLFRTIQQLAGRYSPLDRLMILISNKVRYVFAFVLVFMWFQDRRKEVFLYAMISMLLTLFINILMKSYFYKPRPFIKHHVDILIPSKVDSSFPSKHTLLVFAISTSIFLGEERILGSIMWGLSVLTGFSRIWVGHHYPSDVIASAFIGSLISIIIDKILSLV